MKSKSTLNCFDNIHAVFFDLDGTLLNSQKQISPALIENLKKIKNKYHFHFGIATGRNLSSVKPILSKYHLEQIMDVVVYNNGADLLLRDGKQLNFGKISDQQVQQILEKFGHNPHITVFFHNPSVLYATKINQAIKQIQKNNHETEIKNPMYDSYCLPSRIVLYIDNNEWLQKIKNQKIEGLKGYNSEPFIYEYVNPNVSKSNGICEYMKTLQDTLENVMVFGDGENDQEMILHCGYGIAMKNGTKTIQKIAKEVTGYTNDEDGIIRFFEQYLEW
ncbi:MAG: HAD family hydrolase [Floccifex sp.]